MPSAALQPSDDPSLIPLHSPVMTKGKKISDSLNQTTKGEIPSILFEAATGLQKTRGRVGYGEEGATGAGGDKPSAFRAKAADWGRGLQKGLGIPGEKSLCCMVPTLARGGKPGGCN